MRRLYRLPFLPLWLLFWCIAVVLYGIAWRSGFERDFHGWLEMFSYKSFADCINRKGVGVTSLYQVTQLELWAWTKLFGTHLIPWFLLQTGLFAAAGALLTVFLRKLYEDFGWQKAAPIAFWGSVFSIAAPHNAEIAIWKASYHYPVAVLLIAGILLLLRRAFLHNSGKALAGALVLYALSTFTLELFYATLPLALFMALLYARHQKSFPFYPRKAVIGLLVMLFLFLTHFWLYHLVYDNYIPHQQGAVEAFLKEPVKGFGHFLQNEFHLLFQGRYWPQESHAKVYNAVFTKKGGGLSIAFLVAALLFTGVSAWRREKGAPLFWVTAAAVGGSLLIITTWVIDWGLYYNDRLLYFTGLFQWQLVAVLLFLLRNRTATIFSVLLAAVLSSFTLYTALQCRRAAKVFWQVMETFRWKGHKGQMILLNVPANLKGIVFYQEGPSNNELNSHLQIFTGDSALTHPLSVAGYNMEDTADGARVRVENDSLYYVTLIRPGLWYWNTTLGAASHENSLYKMTLDEWAHQYKLELRDTSALLLYFNRGTWKEVDKTRRGAEQQ